MDTQPKQDAMQIRLSVTSAMKERKRRNIKCCKKPLAMTSDSSCRNRLFWHADKANRKLHRDIYQSGG